MVFNGVFVLLIVNKNLSVSPVFVNYSQNYVFPVIDRIHIFLPSVVAALIFLAGADAETILVARGVVRLREHGLRLLGSLFVLPQ